jgi:hypothetical protein
LVTCQRLGCPVTGLLHPGTKGGLLWLQGKC